MMSAPICPRCESTSLRKLSEIPQQETSAANAGSSASPRESPSSTMWRYQCNDCGRKFASAEELA